MTRPQSKKVPNLASGALSIRLLVIPRNSDPTASYERWFTALLRPFQKGFSKRPANLRKIKGRISPIPALTQGVGLDVNTYDVNVNHQHKPACHYLSCSRLTVG